jgi:phenylpyruvate tautomerase PptA (4-oxalocrotonate tautomerase family)
MPIIDVEIVSVPEADMPRDLAQRLADALGTALAAPAGTTWIRLRALASDRYAENGVTVAAFDLPVFVTVLKRQLPDVAERATECGLLARTVGDITGRPADRVHVEYAPAGAGRVAFGGKLVE